MESKTRSLTKAILWTALGFVMMLSVGYISTGSWAVGGGMALINSCLGLVSYVIYERIWARIVWGVTPVEQTHG